MEFHGDEDECRGNCGLCEDCLETQERKDEMRMERRKEAIERQFKKAWTQCNKE